MKLLTPASLRRPKSIKKIESPFPIPEMTSTLMTAPPVNDVALRAYYSYQNQGAGHGYDLEHWHAAEASLIQENRQTQV